LNLSDKIIWTITDGSQGMISQTNGLARQLSSNIIELKTELVFPWSKLQPGFLPIFKWIFKNEFDFSLKPNIVISCGRKSVYTSLYLKKIFKKNIIVIHIQNPKVNSRKFDYVVVPNHDNYYGKNVLNSFGAIHHFTHKIIEEYKDNIEILEKENLVSVVIGGPNRHYKFSNKAICDLIDNIKILQKKFKNLTFFIVPSRRTNKTLLDVFIKKLKGIAYVWDKKSKNPYIFSLKYSKFFIVTSDSTSMISECAFTGKPVYVYHLPYKRNSERISRFHKWFEENKITRKLKDNLEIWNYKPLNEAERIAGILRIRILNK
jgi:hypothetical protein